MKAAYDKTHAIAQAVEPLRTDAIKRATDVAAQQVTKMLADLEKAGWDLNKVAPRAHSRMGRAEYRTAQAKRGLYSNVCVIVSGNGYRDDVTIVRYCNTNASRFIENAGRDASLQYDAFICKMIGKIGECSSASLHGSHVWGHSFLTVETPAGTEVWKTQQIINVSPLGTVFNQWPSRKVSK